MNETLLACTVVTSLILRSSEVNFLILKIIIPPRGSVSGHFIARCLRCVSSVAVVNQQKHVINAVMATVIARMRV